MVASKNYFINLDKLRSIAFFLVFWQHSLSKFQINADIFSDLDIFDRFLNRIIFTGGIGVHLFFVLSGFLITYLLCLERNKNFEINITFFYLRRALRIWPLYYLIIFLGTILLPEISNNFYFNGNFYCHFLFLNNFDIVKSPVGIAWSVAIEEQFYVLWPIIFIVSKNKLKLVSILLLVLSFCFTYSNNDFSELYYHSFYNIKYLMAGCLFGLLYHEKNMILEKTLESKLFKLHWIVLLIIIFFTIPTLISGFYLLCEILLITMIGLLIVFLVESSNKQNGFLAKTGKYTYGLYLYHPFVILGTKTCFDKVGFNYIDSCLVYALLIILSFLMTYFIAYYSYNYFEKYFLKMKNKYSLVNK